MQYSMLSHILIRTDFPSIAMKDTFRSMSGTSSSKAITLPSGGSYKSSLTTDLL